MTRSATCPKDIQDVNLFFQLITKTYEKATTILTANKAFSLSHHRNNRKCLSSPASTQSVPSILMSED